jgi:hypothetical protein
VADKLTFWPTVKVSPATGELIVATRPAADTKEALATTTKRAITIEPTNFTNLLIIFFLIKA